MIYRFSSNKSRGNSQAPHSLIGAPCRIKGQELWLISLQQQRQHISSNKPTNTLLHLPLHLNHYQQCLLLKTLSSSKRTPRARTSPGRLGVKDSPRSTQLRQLPPTFLPSLARTSFVRLFPISSFYDKTSDIQLFSNSRDLGRVRKPVEGPL